jgi:ElaB/YqjD/DUF883 family membrane-anchored ribosome-binding protein
MPSPHAELSSLSSMLEELAKRVTELAERSGSTADDWLAAELFQVERSLGEARRRLNSISGRIGG